MDITPPLNPSRQLIQRYGAGAFVIAGQEHEGSVLVWPERRAAWEVAQFEEITEEALLPVLESGGVEILIVGSGEKQEFFPPALRQAIRARGIAVECMDTGAACRTFNILMGDDRKVAAALIAV